MIKKLPNFKYLLHFLLINKVFIKTSKFKFKCICKTYKGVQIMNTITNITVAKIQE